MGMKKKSKEELMESQSELVKLKHKNLKKLSSMERSLEYR